MFFIVKMTGFTREGFYKDSLKILDYDSKIIQVWLESRESASRLDIFSYGPLKKHQGIGLEVYCKDGWEWGYFSLSQV